MVGNDQISVAINDVTDLVTTNKTLEDGDIVRYDFAKTRWEAYQLTFDGLPDVVLSTPADGQVLVFDGVNNEWINETLVSRFDDLEDVVVNNPQANDIIGWNGSDWSNGPLWLNNVRNVDLTQSADGQVLTYDATNNVWVNMDIPPSSSVDVIDDLSDVTISKIKPGQVLVWDNNLQQWVNVDFDPGSDLGSVDLQNLVPTQALKWNGTDWINDFNYLTSLRDVDVDKFKDGQILVYDQTRNVWVNKELVYGIEEMTDVSLNNLQQNHILRFNGTEWTNNSLLLETIEDVVLNSPVDTHYLGWDGTQWTNKAVSLDTLKDVDLTGRKDISVLVYNDKAKEWKPESLTINHAEDVQMVNPVDGQILRWSHLLGVFVNHTPRLGDDSDIEFNNLQDRQVPVYDSVNSVWRNEHQVTKIDDLDDVVAVNPDPSDVIGWDGSAWVSGPLWLGNLGNVYLYGSKEGQALTYDSVSQRWINKTLEIDSLDDAVITTPTLNQVLAYDDSTSKWINKEVSTLPDAKDKAGYEITTRGATETDAEWSPFRTTPNLVDADYTIEDNVSASIVSPTIDDGVTITVPVIV